VTAQNAYADADAMVLPGGVLVRARRRPIRAAAVDQGDTASRNAWITGTAALVSGRRRRRPLVASP